MSNVRRLSEERVRAVVADWKRACFICQGSLLTHGDYYLLAGFLFGIFTFVTVTASQTQACPSAQTRFMWRWSFRLVGIATTGGSRGGMIGEEMTCSLFLFIDEFLYFYSLKWSWHVEEMESKCSNQAQKNKICFFFSNLKRESSTISCSVSW